MSSRQEEKARRRQEREELERKANAAAARRRRLGVVGIALAAIAAIAVIGVVIASGGSDDGGGSGGDPQGEVQDAPTQDNTSNLQAAVEAAGCTVKKERNEGSEHTSEEVTYQANPPTSGNHDATPAEDGDYQADNPPDVGQSLHSLEHGRITVQYKPGTPPQRIAQLRGLLSEEYKGTEGYKTLLFQNQTGMEPAVAATAWTQSLKCPQWNDQVFDAIRAFREDYVDKAPEFVP